MEIPITFEELADVDIGFFFSLFCFSDINFVDNILSAILEVMKMQSSVQHLMEPILEPLIRKVVSGSVKCLSCNTDEKASFLSYFSLFFWILSWILFNFNVDFFLILDIYTS